MALLRSGTRIYGTATVDSQLFINGSNTATSAAISTTTGALQVIGGAGIGGDLWLGGGNINIVNTITNFIMGNNNLTSTSTSNIVLGRNLAGDAATIKTYAGTGTNLRIFNGIAGYHFELASYATSGWGPTGANDGTRIRIDGATGDVSILNTSTSTSPTTGALTIAGGVGIKGDLWVGGKINATIVGISSTATTLQTDPQNNNASYHLTFVNTNTSGAKAFYTTSSFVINPGTSSVGIKNSNPSYPLDVTGDIHLSGTLRMDNTQTAQINKISSNGIGNNVDLTLSAGTSTGVIRLQYFTTATLDALTVAPSSGFVTIHTSTNSTSTTTGALSIKGGVGIGRDLYVGGTIYGNITGIITTASNINAGTVGQILFQSNTSTTSFAGPGSTGSILVSAGTTSTGPVFTNTSTFKIGYAVTATTLEGGSPQAIVYQSNTGTTAFLAASTSGYFLQTNGPLTPPLWVSPSGVIVGVASQVQTIQQTSTTTNYYPTFVDSNNSSLQTESIYTTSSFSINPGTGNVGIGGGGTNDQLYVYRSGQGSTGITAASNTGTNISLMANRGSGGNTPLTQGGDASIIYSAGAIDTGSLVIGQWSSSPRGIRIDSSGKVGIGKSDPTAKLDIGGTTINTQQAILARSVADGNFQLSAFNANTSTNTSGSEVARFGIAYNGSNSTDFSSGFSFIRGSGANDGALSILTNNTERIRITSAGGVAFGGAVNYGEPNQILQSNGNAAPTWVYATTITAGSASLTSTYVGFGSTGNTLTGTDKLTWNGTTFLVNGGSLATGVGSQTIIQRLAGTNANASYLDFSMVRDSAGADWTYAGSRIQQKTDSTWQGWMQFNGNNNQGGIAFGTGGSTTAPLSITEKMRIDSNGNVGIGITPVVSLDVAGRGRFLQNVAATSGAIVLRQATGDTEGSFIQWVNNANTAEKGWIHIDTSSNMKFATVSTERMRITSAGAIAFSGPSNYGNPGQILQSNGNGPPTWINTSTIVAGSIIGGTVNYATSVGWAIGTGDQIGFYGGNFTINGTSSENSIIYGTDPFGRRSMLWAARNNDATSNDDGGWNKTITGLNYTKSYMSVVYVRRNGSSTSGSFYHGCDGSNTLNLNGSANSNPYFSAFGISTLPQDVWCVSIGFIQAYGDSNTANMLRGGLYRMDTGQLVTAYTDYKMASGATQQVHRTYLYYSTDAAASLDWWGSSFYEINGNEPNLEQLLGSNNAGWRKSWYAPRYYDSDNVNYYLDPSSSSNLGTITSNTHNINAGNSLVNYGLNNNGGIVINSNSVNWGLMINYSADDWRLGWGTNTIGILSTNWGLRWDATGNAYANSGMRAPVFYDNDNAAYYADFATAYGINHNGISSYSKMRLGLTYKYNTARNDYTSDSNYWTGVMGWSTTDFNTMFDWGSGFTDSWGSPGYQPAGTSHWNTVQAMHYTNGSNRYGWQLTMGAGSPGLTYIRGSWGAAFSDWYKLHLLGVNSGGTSYASIYYDSDDAAFYVDPNSTSSLSAINYGILLNRNAGSVLGSGYGSYAYAIFQEAGAWTYPYPDLRIANHTGIKFGANPSYEGMRFFSDYDMSSVLFQVNGSSSYSFKYTWLYTNGSGFYSDTNSAHFYPNNGSYGAWRIDGSRNGWQGIEFGGHTTLMMNNDSYGFHKNDTGWRLYLTGGYLYVPYEITAYWSDRRLKENISELKDGEGMALIDRLKPSRFTWRKEAEYVTQDSVKSGVEEISMIAQDTQEILPIAVRVNKTGKKSIIDGEEITEFLTINYNKITPYLIQAVKDLKQEIERLKKRLGDE